MKKQLLKILSLYKKLLRGVLKHTRNNENRIFRFYRESNGDWYVDLPEWNGGRWHLEMVNGADDFLDEICSDTEDEVYLQISTQPNAYQSDIVLEKLFNTGSDGAEYFVLETPDDLYVSVDQLWLCGVTEWVYGYMPDKIYCRKVLVK